MVVDRSSLLAALVPISLVACGGGGGGNTVTPEGMHYHYVVNQIDVPTNNAQSMQYGLDLDGDGHPDNALGAVLGALQTAAPTLNVQGTIDKSIAEGSIILLADFQSTDLMNSNAAGFQVFLGANPQPPACNGSADMYSCTTATPPVCTGCGHHLTGTGMMSIDPSSPQNVALSGTVVNGTFKGGPGDLTLQLALGGTMPISLNLIGARAQGSGITATQIGTDTDGGMILGGALTQDDLNNKVIPAIQTQLVPAIAKDCTDLTNPPDCGCAAGSTGKTILSIFDTNPKDCTVTVMEIETNNLIMNLLAPDVTVEGKMAISLGVRATAVGATYTAPNETM